VDELALVHVIEAVRHAGEAEGERRLPPVPHPGPLPGGGAQMEHTRIELDRLEEIKLEDSFINRGKKQQKAIKSLCVRP
jgi:hypothetical protein